MTTHIGIDIDSAWTHVVIHAQRGYDDGGWPVVHRYATSPGRLPACLDAVLHEIDVAWSEVAVLAVAASVAVHDAWLRQELGLLIRRTGFGGRLYFVQPDASLSIRPWIDDRAASVAGMLAASVLCRLTGEDLVVAVDANPSGFRGALIREGRLPQSVDGITLQALDSRPADDLRALCAQSGEDLRDVTLLVFGSAAPAVAAELSLSLDCARIVLPLHAEGFRAWGLLQGELRFHRTNPLSTGDELAVHFAGLQSALLREAHAEGVAEGDLRFERTERPGHVVMSASASLTRPWLPIPTSNPAPGTTFTGPVQVGDAADGLHLPAGMTLTIDSYGNRVMERTEAWVPQQHRLAAQRAPLLPSLLAQEPHR